MRHLLTLLIAAMTLMSSTSFATTGGPQMLATNQDLSILGFQAWRSHRIDEAKVALDRLQSEIAGPNKNQAAKLKAVHGDQRVQQAQLNVEIARELSVNDYFVLYLNQLKSREAMIEAAKKLSPDETADLMLAYQKAINTSSAPDAPPSLVNGLSGGTPAAGHQ